MVGDLRGDLRHEKGGEWVATLHSVAISLKPSCCGESCSMGVSFLKGTRFGGVFQTETKGKLC